MNSYKTFIIHLRSGLLLALLLLSGVTQVVLPAPRTEQVARQIAESFFATSPQSLRSWSSSQMISLELAEPRAATKGSSSYSTSDQVSSHYYYIYNRGAQGGFVIISGDDRYPELIGYAYEGHINGEDMPESLRSFLRACQETMDAADADPSLARELRAEITTLRNAKSEVAPLLGDICWDQGAPWNDQTPRHQGSTTAVGCVATAYTQVMRYWQWPDRGVGTHTYTYGYDYEDNEGNWRVAYNTLTANFDKEYHWDLMPARASIYASAEERNALSTLASDAGIAVDMMYGDESGTHTPLVIRALRDHFRYKKDLYMPKRRDYTAQDWSDLLKVELSQGRPIVYEGGGFGGLHCFVCDGYDTRGFFHFNWGWSGSGNGYFNLNYLVPNTSGIGGGAGGGYSQGQGAIIGIEPDREGTSTPVYNAWLGTIVFEAEVSGGKSITLESASFTSRLEDAPAYQGRVAIGIVSLQTQEVIPIVEQVEPFDADLYLMEAKFTLAKPLDLTKYISEGDYMLCPIHEVQDGKGGTYWRANSILYEGDQNRFAIYHISHAPDGNYIVARDYLRALWELELLPDDLKLIASSNTQATVTLQLHNRGSKEYTNRLFVRGRPKGAQEETSWRQLSDDMVTVETGKTDSYTFKLKDNKGLFSAKEIELQVAYYDIHGSLDYLQTATYRVAVRADYEAGADMPPVLVPTTPRYDLLVAKIGSGIVKVSNADSPDAVDLSRVPEGTTLLIEATPSAGTSLTALTVDGVDILRDKRFTVRQNGLIVATFGTSSPEPLYKVSVHCTPADGGTVQLLGADDLEQVPEGTTLQVVVKPAEHFELDALTANDDDILSSKQFVVISDTEVHATFVDHTGVAHIDAKQRGVYPNPATDYITVRTDEEAVIELFASDGLLVATTRATRPETTISVAQLPAGRYMVRITPREGETSLYPLIIQ